MKRLWTAVPVVALGLLGPLLPTAAGAAVAAPPSTKPAAVTKSSGCHVASSIHFKGSRKQYVKVYSGFICTSGHRFIGVSSDFVGGGAFVELRKACHHTSSCIVSSPWMKNPKGKRTYYNAVLGNQKTHWYNIISYQGHRFTYRF